MAKDHYIERIVIEYHIESEKDHEVVFTRRVDVDGKEVFSERIEANAERRRSKVNGEPTLLDKVYETFGRRGASVDYEAQKRGNVGGDRYYFFSLFGGGWAKLFNFKQ